MPVIRQCAYCNKRLLASTYEMIKHIKICEKAKIYDKKKFNKRTVLKSSN